MKLSVFLIFSIVFFGGCAAEISNVEKLTKLCNMQRESSEKAEFVQLVCNLHQEISPPVLTAEQSIFLIKKVDNVDVTDSKALQKELSERPDLLEKVQCFQALIIYGTDDPDLVAKCRSL